MLSGGSQPQAPTYKGDRSTYQIPSLIHRWYHHHGPGFCQVRLLSLPNAIMK